MTSLFPSFLAGPYIAVAVAILVLLLVLDCLQTCSIASHPERWRERNPLLRNFIEDGETLFEKRANVVCYFLVAAVFMAAMVYAATALASSRWGFAVLLVFTLAEAVCVANNYFLGIEPFDVQEL